MAEPGDFYETFANVLRGGDEAAIAPFLDQPHGRERLFVHQNNFAMTVTRAMHGTFKAVSRLVGDEYFAALVRAFVQKQPPQLSTLSRYGGGFADFLRAFEPVQKDLPWLSPVAALDWAWFEAYGAKDSPALQAESLKDVPPEVMPSLAPGLHPSVRLMRFSVPAFSIWRTNIEDKTVQEVPLFRGREWAMVWRQQMQVRHSALDQAQYAFLDAVGGGRSLAEGWIAARHFDPGFDLAKQFADWLNAGVFNGEPDDPVC